MLTPKYCSQCAQPLETRRVGDRPRAVCPMCGTIAYRNPLPVAASVVLNDRREVLLVKRRRPPYEGWWCLPMGFAEIGETVADAARRELREETGIEGRPVQLLDADSFDSERYGDLLIVTFEMEKIGGEETPGDDAVEVCYFPIAHHPQLAFSSNEKALQICEAKHRDHWAIQDSFQALHGAGSQALLSDELVALIQQRAEEIALRWLAEVRTNPTTPSYRRVPPAELLERAVGALSQFGRWLKGDEAAEEIKTFYHALARERRAQGFRACEVLSSLTLLKKHVWAFAGAQGMWDRPIDMYRVLELSRRIAVFFDKALYHTQSAFEAAEG